MDEVVDRPKLIDDRRREYEGIQIWLPHGAIETVQRIAERNPGIDDPREIRLCVRIEVDHGVEGAAVPHLRMNVEPEGLRHFERVDDVEIMGAGLGEILPR